MTTGQSNVVNITPYRSYLVRFWQSNEQGIWRASAQSVQSGNTVLFGDIDHLLAFLQTEIQDNPGAGAEDTRLLPANPI